jgi:hypothetical protein
MDKTNMLQECLINFEVFQDYSSNGKGEKVILGRVSVNLAEYVEAGRYVGEGASDDEEEGVVVRRYLMQESKINSTLKLGIGMVQVDGERNWIAPPLKTAPMFGGIAGIISSEQNIEGQRDDIDCEFPLLLKITCIPPGTLILTFSSPHKLSALSYSFETRYFGY